VFTGTGVVTCSGSTALHPAAVTGLKCPRGQPCCGNGIVETGEVCDDQFCCDATCQARAVAGTPCADDSNACTDDVCNGTGTCTHAIIGAAGCSLPDPYLCYKVGLATGQPQFTPVQKSLQDQFGTLVFDVKRIEGLCNPAQKNTEPPPARPEVHQADYQVAPARGQPAFVKSTHTVIDEFGQHQLRVVKPAALLEPSAKVLGAGGAPVVDTTGVDRFECYRTGAVRFARIAGVQIADQFGTGLYDLTKITELCTPTNKDGEDPTAPEHGAPGLLQGETHARASFPKFQPRPVSINNTNFGPVVLVARAVNELCVPAFKDAVSPPTTTTTLPPLCGDSDAPACNGTCPAGTFCRFGTSPTVGCVCRPIF
jgi:hypothetical protein